MYIVSILHTHRYAHSAKYTQTERERNALTLPSLPCFFLTPTPLPYIPKLRTPTSPTRTPIHHHHHHHIRPQTKLIAHLRQTYSAHHHYIIPLHVIGQLPHRTTHTHLWNTQHATLPSIPPIILSPPCPDTRISAAWRRSEERPWGIGTFGRTVHTMRDTNTPTESNHSTVY